MTVIHYDIPDDIHRKAKVAAATSGMTLKDWLIDAVEMMADSDIHANLEKKEAR